MVGRDETTLGKNMRITVAASQGGRRYMEDRCMIHTERNPDRTVKWVYVGVYDGHGGEYASQYVRINLLDNITANRKFDSENDKDVLEAIREGFLITHANMREVHKTWPYTASGYPSTAGTTVSCVFIRNGKLYTGHVGDSAIFLGTVKNGGIRSVPLTVDHKPESIQEQERIERAGGSTAVKSGVTRVVWHRPVKYHNQKNPPTENIPFLSVARSLGDLWSYCEETDTYVVSPDPDCDVRTLKESDYCLVLCSDGMTNVLTGDQAVSIVFDEKECVELDTDINRNHSRCLLRAALQKWKNLRADNVTVATVIFDSDVTAYQPLEVLMKPGNYASVDQALTEHPDAILHISKTENALLCTHRTPVIYNGSKDINFCRVTYRGPGFRTHEEELQEERRNIITKRLPNGNIVRVTTEYEEEEEDDAIEYDDDEEEEEPGVINRKIKMRVANELTTSIVSTKIIVFPSPTRPTSSEAKANTSTFEPDEGTDEENEENAKTPSKRRNRQIKSPTKTPSTSTLRQLKGRTRTPKITRDVTPEKVGEANAPTEMRLTRSASRAKTPKKQPTLKRRSDGFNENEECPIEEKKVKRVIATPVRRSTRKTPQVVKRTPKMPMRTPAKLTQSRKRHNSEMLQNGKNTGITPAVTNMIIGNGARCAMTPSRSAPTTPKKTSDSSNVSQNGASKVLRPSKWSLSKLDSLPSPSDDGIQRVHENADDYEDIDVVEASEPPSKMRRIYDRVRKFIWGSASGSSSSQK